ncbi:urea amidolyase family protein [Actinotalea sp. K2]|uniref:5-oxoprolinase subunit B/C family protein n=1 Tax=Actinotalea sp. K2 TaxID=2939438 RepID=UPI0020178802|nr:urea amidolyase family protein [Actinotalea sp. K2]MCL3862375.1 5-oxoprolinase/urea amidolyase family protein [Actinotalea sp. K2]
MTPEVRVRPIHAVGDHAIMVQCEDLEEVLALHGELRSRPRPGQVDVVPGACTLMVRTESPAAALALAAELASLMVPPAGTEIGRTLTLDTVYDGPDLETVAARTGLSIEEVVARHAAGTWVAAFVGFAPGFAYLTAPGSGLHVPRHDSPRARVPEGSVALAGSFSAVYPRDSPGGWQLIGRTTARLWDLGREPPALVLPGDRVVFRATREVVSAAHRPRQAPPAPVRPRATRDLPRPSGLMVVSPGPQSLVQDLGRPGQVHLGVGRSGAADRGAAIRANRLVGNDRGAAVIETVLGGLTLQARGRQVLAVTGPSSPLTTRTAHGAGTPPPEVGRPFVLEDGCVLEVGAPVQGLRSYVAVRGGLDVDQVLGSRSTDLLAGIGPDPLRPGTWLGVLPAGGRPVAGWPDAGVREVTGPVRVRVVAGPRDDWFGPAGLASFLDQEWTVTPDANRIGLRLDGSPLVRTRTEELPSEGTVEGAVQVPASGRPVVLLTDHPVTGGYPVVAVVVRADLDLLGQLRPGARLQFEAVTGPSLPRPVMR